MSKKHLIYLAVLVLTALALIIALAKGPPKTIPQMESFTLIYTGNLQGKLLEPSKTEAVKTMVPMDFTTLYLNLAKLKSEAGNRQEPVLFLDLGNSLAGDEDISRQMEGLPIDRLLYEIPYSAMLFRENEYLLGTESLKQLRGRFSYLGLNVRYKKDEGASLLEPVSIIRLGDYTIAAAGYYEPPYDLSGDTMRFDDFVFENNFSLINKTFENIEADVKILLASTPRIMELLEQVEGVDLVIPAHYHPQLNLRRSADIKGKVAAPPVDSRFFVGRARFIRPVSSQNDEPSPWSVTASISPISFSEEVPPGGILNVVLDAAQRMEVEYRGRYRAVYETLIFWEPFWLSEEQVVNLMLKQITLHYNTDGALLDKEAVFLPPGKVWGTRDILKLPGKTLNLSIFEIDEPTVKEISQKYPNASFYWKNSNSSSWNGGSEADGKRFIVADRDLISHLPIEKLTNIQEAPVPGNYAILDSFRNNRGFIINRLGGEEIIPDDAAKLMDCWKYQEAALKLESELKEWSAVEKYIYLGFCYFKGGEFQKALDVWNNAKTLYPYNKGVIRILQAAPLPHKEITISKTGPFWHKFRGDSANTGQIDITGTAAGLLRWRFETQDKVSSSAAIGKDGTIYIGSDDRNLYALKPNGELKWQFTAEMPIRSSPLVSEEGMIYAGSDDKHLYALSPEGKKLWSFESEGYFVSSPNMDKEGTIYLGCDDFNIYAVNKDGTLKWKFPTEGVVFSSPAIGKDGTIYAGSEDRNFYAINPDGSLRWSFETQHKIGSSPAIGEDETIYFGGEDMRLYALNPDGTLKWRTELGNYIMSSPAISKEGIIYIGCEDKNLYAIDKEGAILWKFKTRGEVISSPLVDKQGNIYVGCDGGNLYSITPQGKERWRFMARDPIMSSPAMGPGGIIYIGSEDRNIYAVGE